MEEIKMYECMTTLGICSIADRPNFYFEYLLVLTQNYLKSHLKWEESENKQPTSMQGITDLNVHKCID